MVAKMGAIPQVAHWQGWQGSNPRPAVLEFYRYQKPRLARTLYTLRKTYAIFNRCYLPATVNMVAGLVASFARRVAGVLDRGPIGSGKLDSGRCREKSGTCRFPGGSPKNGAGGKPSTKKNSAPSAVTGQGAEFSTQTGGIPARLFYYTSLWLDAPSQRPPHVLTGGRNLQKFTMGANL